MNYKGLSKGLGWFSIALGAAELLFSKRIASALDADGHHGLVRGFGAREVVAGLGLLDAPAHSTRVWNRVAGDAMDMAALGVAAGAGSKGRALWGAVAFVAGAAALDIWVAAGLDRQTARAMS